MNPGLFRSVAKCLLFCSSLSASINLSDSFVNRVGDVVDFKIPTTTQPDLFGANYLPLGITVEPASGRIHGTLMRRGDWSTVFYALNGQSLQTKTVKWRILETGEEDSLNQSYHVIRARVGEDLAGVYLGFPGPGEVTTVSGLPEGLTFKAETLSFVGSVSEPGLYEIQFSYSQGPAEFLHTVVMTVSSAQPEGRVSLPEFSSASVIYFKGKYYFPANRETVFVSEDLEVWNEVLTVPERYVSEMVQTLGVLIGSCNGGYVISTDGETFEFKMFPNGSSASALTQGKSGVVAEFQDVNGRSLHYSSDGENWEEWDLPMGFGSPPIVVDDTFYVRVLDDYHITRDGSEWRTLERKNILDDVDRNTIVYGNGVFAALSYRDDEIYTSDTGEYWNVQTIRTGVDWNGLEFSEGQFFLWGLDEDRSNPDTILSSSDGKNWSAINLGNFVQQVDEVYQVNGNIVTRQISVTGQTTALDIGPKREVPGFFVPDFMEFPPGKTVFYPLRISGSWTSLRAYGFPRGLSFDAITGAIHGTAVEEPYSRHDVFFVGENRGMPGMIEYSQIYLQPMRGSVPSIGTPCVTGQVGQRLQGQDLSFSPDDHSSQVVITGAPNWLTFDGHSFEGVPTESVDTTFKVEVSNQFGTTSKEIRLIINKPVFELLDRPIGDWFDVREFGYSKGRYFISSNFQSYWSTNLKNWNRVAPDVAGFDNMVSFKEYIYIIDQPGVYKSPDGRGWIWIENIPEIYNPRPGSLFKSRDKLYLVANDRLVCSENGRDWTVLENGERPPHYRVTYQGNYFFAYGLAEDVIYRSRDALNWEVVFDEESDILDMLDIAFGNGIYLAIADGFENKFPILRSTDGQNWEKVEVPENFPESPVTIYFADGQFHIAGSNHQYLFSNDGLDWKLYEYPRRTNSPQFESFMWDGNFLYALGSSSGIYRRVSESFPPVIEPSHDNIFILGQPVDLPINLEGEVNRVELYGAPEGMSFDSSSGKIVGIPLELGGFSACMVAYNDENFSLAARFYGRVADPTKVPNFTADFHVVANRESQIQIADYGEQYHGFELSAENLPNRFRIFNYELWGDNVPAGVYPTDFTLTSPDGLVQQSKRIQLYVSPLFYPFVGNQSLHLRGVVGVPITESVILSGSIEVESVSGLPGGLSYNTNQQLIDGTPTQSGEFVVTVDLVGQSNHFFYRMTIEDDLEFVQPVQGGFDRDSHTYVYRAQVEDPDGYSFQWFYSGYALSDNGTVSGSNSSILRLNSLDNFDPQKFSVQISNAGVRTLIAAPFKTSMEDYRLWADSLQLTGTQGDPLAYGNATGYPNVFLFMQGAAEPDDFISPEIVRTLGGYQFKFVTTKFWAAEDFKILVSKDLKQDFFQLRPLLAEESQSHRTWLTSVADPLANRVFVTLKGRFFED